MKEGVSIMQTQSIHQAQVRQHGIENGLLRYEIIKRNGAFLIELVSTWISHHQTEIGTITKNNREVLCTIFPTMNQNEPEAAPPDSIAGAVAWCKAFSTRTGIPMTVNLPE
jgi:hypothetical protein